MPDSGLQVHYPTTSYHSMGWPQAKIRQQPAEMAAPRDVIDLEISWGDRRNRSDFVRIVFETDSELSEVFSINP